MARVLHVNFNNGDFVANEYTLVPPTEYSAGDNTLLRSTAGTPPSIIQPGGAWASDWVFSVNNHDSNEGSFVVSANDLVPTVGRALIRYERVAAFGAQRLIFFANAGGAGDDRRIRCRYMNSDGDFQAEVQTAGGAQRLVAFTGFPTSGIFFLEITWNTTVWAASSMRARWWLDGNSPGAFTDSTVGSGSSWGAFNVTTLSLGDTSNGSAGYYGRVIVGNDDTEDLSAFGEGYGGGGAQLMGQISI